MRVIVTADLHFDVARSKAPTEAIARDIRRTGGDVLLLVGDSASTDLRVLDQLFSMFDDFTGVKLAVAGNHELWTFGSDSLHRYENELSDACSRNGFHYLDRSPLVVDGVGFVGNVGWYDYSFRPSLMGIPLRFFQNKVAPGAAARMEEYRHLVDGWGDVSEAAMQLTTRWMDGVRVNLPMSDIEFTQRLAAKLRTHLVAVQDRSDRIIAAIHHLPFADMVPHSLVPDFEFATAYHGSEVFGEALLECPKVTHVFSGHCHRERRLNRRHLQCMSIGSTYTEKKFEVLDVSAAIPIC